MKITTAAKDKILALITDQKPYFRISIQSGGCSGFERQFSLETQAELHDRIFENVVLVDPISYDLISHAELTWVQNIANSEFVLTLPDATATCGCGKSFHLP